MSNQCKVRKAIIPAAGLGTRFLPATKALPKEMFPIVDTPAIQFIVEEAQKSGISDILIITSESKNAIVNHFDHNELLEQTLIKKGKLTEYHSIHNIANNVNVFFMRQKGAYGLGDAILKAEAFVDGEPFAVLLGDDVIFSNKGEEPALKQCIDCYCDNNCSVVGVQKVAHESVHKYGIIKPSTISSLSKKFIKITTVIEKPIIEKAPSDMAILGRYVLTPKIFNFLRKVKPDRTGEIQFTEAIARQAATEMVYACNFTGRRYDIGQASGFVNACIDRGLSISTTRSDIIEHIKEILKKL